MVLFWLQGKQPLETEICSGSLSGCVLANSLCRREEVAQGGGRRWTLRQGLARGLGPSDVRRSSRAGVGSTGVRMKRGGQVFTSLYPEALISHPKWMSYVIGCEVIPKLHQNLFIALPWQSDFLKKKCCNANSPSSHCPFSEISSCKVSSAFQKVQGQESELLCIYISWFSRIPILLTVVIASPLVLITVSESQLLKALPY